MPKDSFTIALRFLKFRPRSVFEVAKKLKEKKISQDEIDKTIKVLKNNKLLNDAEFAKMWVRDRNLLSPRGSYLLKLELKKLGIAQEQIEAALVEQDEEELARRALESKRQYQKADFIHRAQFLQRRGFKMSVIVKVLKN